MNDSDTYIEEISQEDIMKEITSGYKFSTDWFTRHKKLWDSLFEQVKPKKILEIGSFEGRATTYMIEKCGAWHDTEIFCVDAWKGNYQHSDEIDDDFDEVKKRFDHNIKFAKDKVEFDVNVLTFVADSVLGCSQIAAQDIRDFDLIYIDGSHIASNVFFDAAIAFQLCKVGGAIIFDDYREDKYLPYLYPKMAIDAFHKVYENKIRYVEFFTDGEPIPMENLYQRYFWKISQ